jgi:hypothetical protein
MHQDKLSVLRAFKIVNRKTIFSKLNIFLSCVIKKNRSVLTILDQYLRSSIHAMLTNFDHQKINNQ